jgi:multicomponent Na+:H+ antiporter subunit E
MALVGYGLGLALIWVLAWGTPTPANILGGLAVAGLLLAVSPDARPTMRRTRIRPVAIARFVGFVLVEVVTANVHLTRAIVSRDARLRTAVLATPLPPCSNGLLTLITNTMAVTPGTMPIEVTREPTVIYFHALLIGDIEDARRSVERLAGLAYRAFGSDEAIAALASLRETQR